MGGGNKYPIVVAIGDSDSHDAALRFAADEAVRGGNPLCLVHVVHPPREGMFPEQMLITFKTVELAASQLLRSQVDRAVSLTRGAVPVTHVLRHGSVVDTLLKVAEGADHLVLQHRQQARLLRVFTGSIASGVAAHAQLPVVSVPEFWSGPSNHDVVVGLESVDQDESLLLHGIAEARARDARLTVLHSCYLPPLYDGVQLDRLDLHSIGESVRVRIESALVPMRAQHPDVDVRVELMRMRPADALVERSGRSDLLVLGRGGSAPAVGHLGSVTRAVLREALCPVVVLGALEPGPRYRRHTHDKASAS
jgi:nucleotide-binding universal stress UspA family protein